MLSDPFRAPRGKRPGLTYPWGPEIEIYDPVNSWSGDHLAESVSANLTPRRSNGCGPQPLGVGTGQPTRHHCNSFGELG